MNQKVYPDTWYLRKFVFDGQNSVERGYNINKQALVEILYHFGDQRKKKNLKIRKQFGRGTVNHQDEER